MDQASTVSQLQVADTSRMLIPVMPSESFATCILKQPCNSMPFVRILRGNTSVMLEPLSLHDSHQSKTISKDLEQPEQ